MNMDIEHVSCFSAGDSDAACGHLAQPVGNCVFCQWLQAHFGKRMFFVCIRKMEIPAIPASEPYINNFHILFRDLKFFLQSDNFLGAEGILENFSHAGDNVHNRWDIISCSDSADALECVQDKMGIHLVLQEMKTVFFLA